MAGFDPYTLLNVPREAKLAEIRSAYRRLAKTAHPDKGGTAEGWAKLKRAFDILMNAAARAHFDATGEAADPKRDPGDIKPMEYISLALGKALTGQKDLLGIDLVKAIAEALSHHRGEAQGYVETGERAMERLKRLRNRFKRKMPGNNDMEGMLDWHEQQLEVGLAHNRTSIKDLSRALEIIEQYEFNPEGGGWMLPGAAQSSTASRLFGL